jgi:hypothetical protein
VRIVYRVPFRQDGSSPMAADVSLPLPAPSSA